MHEIVTLSSVAASRGGAAFPWGSPSKALMDYLVGDVQGCCNALERLLHKLDFSPSRDRLWLLGDLVNRGPQSLATLRKLRSLGPAATCLLGNHDLHLLAVAAGVRKEHCTDTLREILVAADRDAWIDWLRQRPLMAQAQGWLLVHAGLAPQWTGEQALDLAREVQTLLRGPDLHGFLAVMYGNEPGRWRDDLAGPHRWRFAINVFTRIRFCRADGTLELNAKETAERAPEGLYPWFEAPGRCTAGVPVAFGHWSTLGLVNRPDLLATDTGCVWGGQLTAVRVDGGRREVIQVACEQAQMPS